MSLNAALLTQRSLVVTRRGIALRVGLNWYRSLPLSSVQTVELTLDQYRVPRGDIRFELNGKSHMLDGLQALWQEEWYVLDLATLRFSTPFPLTVGQEIDVTVRMGNLIPYILVGPDRPLEYISVKTKRLRAVAEIPELSAGELH